MNSIRSLLIISLLAINGQLLANDAGINGEEIKQTWYAHDTGDGDGFEPPQ